jgi:hypothetical protein
MRHSPYMAADATHAKTAAPCTHLQPGQQCSRPLTCSSSPPQNTTHNTTSLHLPDATRSPFPHTLPAAPPTPQACSRRCRMSCCGATWPSPSGGPMWLGCRPRPRGGGHTAGSVCPCGPSGVGVFGVHCAAHGVGVRWMRSGVAAKRTGQLERGTGNCGRHAPQLLHVQTSQYHSV